MIELYDMHCVGYVCVTQRKDPEEELLCAPLGSRAIALLKLSRSSG